MDKCNGICLPFIIYIILVIWALMAIYKAKKYDFSLQIIVLLLYMLITTILLYYLCSTCHNRLGLLLLPIIIMYMIGLSFTGDWAMKIFK